MAANTLHAAQRRAAMFETKALNAVAEAEKLRAALGSVTTEAASAKNELADVKSELTGCLATLNAARWSESRLMAQLDREQAERKRAEATIITLSHRLALLEDADRREALDAPRAFTAGDEAKAHA